MQLGCPVSRATSESALGRRPTKVVTDIRSAIWRPTSARVSAPWGSRTDAGCANSLGVITDDQYNGAAAQPAKFPKSRPEMTEHRIGIAEATNQKPPPVGLPR
jgi:hypothetical protein